LSRIPNPVPILPRFECKVTTMMIMMIYLTGEKKNANLALSPSGHRIQLPNCVLGFSNLL